MLSFEPLLKKMIAYSTKVSYYMLGSSSSNSERDKYINTWIRVQYRFIFLVFLFSELFGTRAYALVQITHKIKKLAKVNLILHSNACVKMSTYFTEINSRYFICRAKRQK